MLLLGRSRLQRTRDNSYRYDLLALRMDNPLKKAADHLRKGIMEEETLSDEVQGARVPFEGKKQWDFDVDAVSTGIGIIRGKDSAGARY